VLRVIAEESRLSRGEAAMRKRLRAPISRSRALRQRKAVASNSAGRRQRGMPAEAERRSPASPADARPPAVCLARQGCVCPPRRAYARRPIARRLKET